MQNAPRGYAERWRREPVLVVENSRLPLARAGMTKRVLQVADLPMNIPSRASAPLSAFCGSRAATARPASKRMSASSKRL
jgi:hypothetical protein